MVFGGLRAGHGGHFSGEAGAKRGPVNVAASRSLGNWATPARYRTICDQACGRYVRSRQLLGAAGQSIYPPRRRRLLVHY